MLPYVNAFMILLEINSLLWLNFLFGVLLDLQYILLMERSLPVVQHGCGQFLHVFVAVLKVLLLRPFSDVCCRKSTCADVLRQGQI